MRIRTLWLDTGGAHPDLALAVDEHLDAENPDYWMDSFVKETSALNVRSWRVVWLEVDDRLILEAFGTPVIKGNVAYFECPVCGLERSDDDDFGCQSDGHVGCDAAQEPESMCGCSPACKGRPLVEVLAEGTT